MLNKAQEVYTGLFTLLINIGIVLFFEAVLSVYCSFHFVLNKLSLNLGKRAPLLNYPRAPCTVNPPLARSNLLQQHPHAIYTFAKLQLWVCQEIFPLGPKTNKKMSTILYLTNFLKYSQTQIWEIMQRNGIKKQVFKVELMLIYHFINVFKKAILGQVERSSKNLE